MYRYIVECLALAVSWKCGHAAFTETHSCVPYTDLHTLAESKVTHPTHVKYSRESVFAIISHFCSLRGVIMSRNRKCNTVTVAPTNATTRTLLTETTFSSFEPIHVGFRQRSSLNEKRSRDAWKLPTNSFRVNVIARSNACLPDELKCQVAWCLLERYTLFDMYVPRKAEFLLFYLFRAYVQRTIFQGDNIESFIWNATKFKGRNIEVF